MAACVLDLRREFRRGGPEFGHEEVRVVAESAGTTGPIHDLPMPRAGRHDGRGIVRTLEEHQRAVEVGAAVGAAFEGGHQLGVVVGGGGVRAGETRRVDAGRAAEGGNHQSGVVANGRQARDGGGVARLEERVLHEGPSGFLRRRNVEGGSRMQFHGHRSEQAGQLAQLAGVRAGEHDPPRPGHAHSSQYSVCWKATVAGPWPGRSATISKRSASAWG